MGWLVVGDDGGISSPPSRRRAWPEGAGRRLAAFSDRTLNERTRSDEGQALILRNMEAFSPSLDRASATLSHALLQW